LANIAKYLHDRQGVNVHSIQHLITISIEFLAELVVNRGLIDPITDKEEGKRIYDSIKRKAGRSRKEWDFDPI